MPALKSESTARNVDAPAVALAVEGDVRARQQAIYAERATAVVRRLTHMTGDPALAQDVAQDAFVTAFAKLDDFRGDAALATWLHAIAYNHLRDRRRRQRRELSLWARLRRQPIAALGPDQQLQSREDLARLEAILMTLPERQRDAFVLRVVEQASLKESAEILGAREATISYRARRAEAQVRAAFEGED